MERITIYLAEDQYRRLKERAKEQGISLSELVRRFVETGLTVSEPDEELRKRALSVIGCCRSETGDVVEKHNEYFAESVISH